MTDFKKGCVQYIRGGKFPSCHSIFIDDAVRVVIDPACGKKILQEIEQEKAVDIILNSHCHEDHYKDNFLFPHARLWVSEAEAPFYRSLDKIIDGWIDPELTGSEYDRSLRKHLIEKTNFRECEPDRLLHDGDILDFGKTKVEVVLLPGHTVGHTGFLFLKERALYTADIDLVPAGPYYADKSSDIDMLIASLKKIEQMDVDYFLTAHGRDGVVEGDPNHIRTYLGMIYEREEKILDFLKKGAKTLKEITELGIIYGSHQKMGVWDLKPAEERMMQKHLVKLLRQKRIYKEGDRFGLIAKMVTI